MIVYDQTLAKTYCAYVRLVSNICVGSTLTREPYRAFPTWPTKVPAWTQKHMYIFQLRVAHDF